MSIVLCRILNCNGKQFASGYCAAHLRRKRRGQSMRRPIKRRVWGSRVARTPEFRAWTQINYRCFNPNSKNFKDYGARGITVCKRWEKFENFLADMGRRPPGLSIDRINNNRGYSPSNCKWSTHSEQMKNRRPRSQWTFK